MTSQGDPRRDDIGGHGTGVTVAEGVSGVVVARRPSERLVVQLELLRPWIGELIVAVDDRAGDDGLGALEEVADVVATFAFRDAIEHDWAWIASLAGREWLLWIDEDEVPSPRLLERLPELAAARDVTHYHVRRTWVWPDGGAALAEPPWRPEFVPRLFRSDPAVVWYPGIFHLPVKQVGPFRWVDEGLLHLDLVVSDVASRRKKVQAYEARRPGLRIAGRPLNEAFYLPEGREPLPRSRPLADAERALVKRVLDVSDAPLVGRPPGGPVHRGTPDDIGATDRRGDDVGRSGGGRISVLEPPSSMLAGVETAVEIDVTNLSDDWWPPGGFHVPEVRVSYHWRRPDGMPAEVPEQLRTSLPAALAPGGDQRVVVDVAPPSNPGAYVLEFDLVREDVRWFGCAAPVDVEVLHSRVVAVLVDPDDEAFAASVAGTVVLALPAVRVVLVARDPGAVSERHGYETIADCWAGLFTGRLRDSAFEAARTLMGRLDPAPPSDLLVVAGGERLAGERGRREAWRALAAVRAFQQAGAGVLLVDRGPGVLAWRATTLPSRHGRSLRSVPPEAAGEAVRASLRA